MRRPAAPTYLLEAFVDGEELHVDGVVRGGSIQAMAVSRYTNKPLDRRRGAVVDSVVLDPVRFKQYYAQSTDVAARVLRALDRREGVFHLEAFRSGDRYLFSECAALPGAA